MRRLDMLAMATSMAVVFTSLRDGDRELYLMGADGIDQRYLTRFPEADDNLARWSPDRRSTSWTPMGGTWSG